MILSKIIHDIKWDYYFRGNIQKQMSNWHVEYIKIMVVYPYEKLITSELVAICL